MGKSIKSKEITIKLVKIFFSILIVTGIVLGFNCITKPNQLEKECLDCFEGKNIQVVDNLLGNENNVQMPLDVFLAVTDSTIYAYYDEKDAYLAEIVQMDSTNNIIYTSIPKTFAGAIKDIKKVTLSENKLIINYERDFSLFYFISIIILIIEIVGIISTIKEDYFWYLWINFKDWVLKQLV